MATATVPAAPTLTAGSTSSEFTLAKLAGFLGVGMILGGVALSIWHPLPDVQSILIKYGFLLMGTTGVVYGGFRTFLKYLQLSKGYDAMVTMATALIPGQAGVDVRNVVTQIEKIRDALLAAGQTSATPPPATQAVTAAISTPVAPAGSPSAPSAA